MTTLTACQSMGHCGGADQRDWKLLPAPPTNSANLRALAAQANPFGKSLSQSKEKWFRLGSEQLMLCRETFEFGESDGYWWQFTLDKGQFAITEQQGWVYIE